MCWKADFHDSSGDELEPLVIDPSFALEALDDVRVGEFAFDDAVETADGKGDR